LHEPVPNRLHFLFIEVFGWTSRAPCFHRGAANILEHRHLATLEAQKRSQEESEAKQNGCQRKNRTPRRLERFHATSESGQPGVAILEQLPISACLNVEGSHAFAEFFVESPLRGEFGTK
jgi:hypothetical protein